MNKLNFLYVLPLCFVFSAKAQTYHPDFDCNRITSNNSVGHLLCEDSASAKQELIFDQTYYALRQQVGRSGWKDLKKEVIEDQKSNAACLQGTPDANGRQPVDPICFQDKTAKLTEKYKRRLRGPALEEANRPIDEHIALQKRLVDLGFLPPNTKVDGVYGAGVRQAIETWQSVNRRPHIDGFISDEDADGLMSKIPFVSKDELSNKNDIYKSQEKETKINFTRLNGRWELTLDSSIMNSPELDYKFGDIDKLFIYPMIAEKIPKVGITLLINSKFIACDDYKIDLIFNSNDTIPLYNPNKVCTKNYVIFGSDLKDNEEIAHIIRDKFSIPYNIDSKYHDYGINGDMKADDLKIFIKSIHSYSGNDEK